MLKTILKSMVIVMVSSVIGFLLLILTYSLPMQRQISNICKSAKMLEDEGISYDIISGYDTTRQDNYTEGLTFNSALYNGEESVVEKAAAVYQYRYEDTPMYYDALIEFTRGEEGYYRDEYARDWHGYLVVVKPLLLIMDYAGIRCLNLIIQLCLIGWIFTKLSDVGKGSFSFPFMGLLLALSAPTIFMSMEYSALFYIILGSILIVLQNRQTIYEQGEMALLFVVIGILVAYVDVLTYPIVTYCVPLILLYYLDEKKHELRGSMLLIVYTGIHWLIGYAGMWSIKWMIASVFTGKNVIKDAILMALYRASSTSAESGEIVRVSYVDVLSRNLGVFCKTQFFILLVISFIIVMIRIVKKKYNYEIVDFFFCLSMCIIPLFWYALVKNHSYIHYWMTYRDISIIVFAVMCMETKSRHIICKTG